MKIGILGPGNIAEKMAYTINSANDNCTGYCRRQNAGNKCGNRRSQRL